MADPFLLDDKKLTDLMKAFTGKMPAVKIGILGDSVRKDGKTNAQIGAIHEYGTSTMPIRSFLRVPINDDLGRTLENSKAFDKATLKKVIKQKSINEWMLNIGLIAEQVVQDAFHNGGSSQTKWKPSNMDHKKVKQTLVETQQLRESITSKVE